MELILKKQSKSYYINRVDNIQIIVSEYKKNWTGTITDESQNDDEKYSIFKCYGSSKKEVTNQIIKFINH